MSSLKSDIHEQMEQRNLAGGPGGPGGPRPGMAAAKPLPTANGDAASPRKSGTQSIHAPTIEQQQVLAERSLAELQQRIAALESQLPLVGSKKPKSSFIRLQVKVPET